MSHLPLTRQIVKDYWVLTNLVNHKLDRDVVPVGYLDWAHFEVM